MKLKRVLPLLTLLLAVLLQGRADAASTAADLTMQALFNGKGCGNAYVNECRDGNYITYYSGPALRITAPQGTTIGSLQLKWRTLVPPEIRVEALRNGAWQKVMTVQSRYASQYIVLPEAAAEIRLTAPGHELELCEVTVLSPGEPPEHIQRWRDPPHKVDMMILSTHPDDEVLWFGGMIPWYAGQQGKDVLVVNAVFGRYERRLELLDSLWTCGADLYPVLLCYSDQSGSTQSLLRAWGAQGERPQDEIVTLLRRYRPDVVALHDAKGEYGHVAHVLFSQLGRQAVKRAGNAAEHPESVKQWGVWDVPKTYIHLWGENQIRMNWQIPMSAFDGATALEVAQRAMLCHKSQLSNNWRVKEGGRYDNALFGLWRTRVGEDQVKNDLFENIP